MHLIPAADPRLSYFCPEPVDRSLAAVRLERFSRAAYDAVNGQIGPLANLRSSSGCAVVLRTDSPRVTVVLERVRHHQPIPCGIAERVGQRPALDQRHPAACLHERARRREAHDAAADDEGGQVSIRA
jgi:hypothetical protein